MTPQQRSYTKNQLQCNDVSTTYNFQKSKEPRFVPYEPYKAAINPLCDRKAKKKQPKILENTSLALPGLAKRTNESKERLKQANQTDEGSVNLNENGNLSNKSKAGNDSESKIENTVDPTSIEILEKTEKLLEEANKKLSESEKQLRIQIQVRISCQLQPGGH